MIKLYDSVKIKKTGSHATVIDIKSDGVPSYLVEIIDDEKDESSIFTDVVFWCDYDEIEELE